MQDMRNNSSSARRPAADTRRVSRAGKAATRAPATSVKGPKRHLTQRVGNSVRGKKRLSPEARQKKDEAQTRWLNALRIEQVRAASEASGWYYLTRAEFDEFYWPLVCMDGTLEIEDHTYKVSVVSDETVALRRIA